MTLESVLLHAVKEKQIAALNIARLPDGRWQASRKNPETGGYVIFVDADITVAIRVAVTGEMPQRTKPDLFA